MYYVYVIQSIKSGDLYFGYTPDLKRRLENHNTGKCKSTKTNMPWKVIYYEAYSSSELAKIREKRLKQFGQSYAMLKKRIGL
ncbi:MAG: GIY-YIG nuclease family protein [Patescibacteria group bacterium]